MISLGEDDERVEDAECEIIELMEPNSNTVLKRTLSFF